MPQNKKTLVGLDGYSRSSDHEGIINENCLSLFNSPTGKEVLKYLKSITIEAVHGSAVSNEVLRHAEGQRYIVGLLERRIFQAIKDKQNG